MNKHDGFRRLSQDHKISNVKELPKEENASLAETPIFGTVRDKSWEKD
tara:strand:- start:307 stop:450 length:144 start_codon:yes stop_codon:yes gene_type:complete